MLLEKYRVLLDKIYVMGLSMGGGGTWDYTIDYGTRLAAIVPISGASWPTTDKSSKRLRHRVFACGHFITRMTQQYLHGILKIM